ncbi:MAG: amylo-alpha-1,6-glucosidase [Chloroflexi bacterium]|nr:amylo-alpha-1,6-glucosidase [Chloroflexota bacterium]
MNESARPNSVWSMAGFDELPAIVASGATRVTSGTVFALASGNGDIELRTHQGFYAFDTRFLSRFMMTLNQSRLLRTGSASFEERLASFYCKRGPFSVVRDRLVENGLHEDISVVNHSTQRASGHLELAFDADFADIFEVRLGRVHKSGGVSVEPRPGQHIALVYRRGDFRRETWIHFSHEPNTRGKTACFDFMLEPKQSWKTCVDILPVADGAAGPPEECVKMSLGEPFGAYKADKAFVGFFRSLNPGAPLEQVPELKSGNPYLCSEYYRAVSDLRALRLKQDGSYILAAGLPWFMTIFGRDSVLSAIQTKILGTDIMVGTMKVLASLQATGIDRFREAEPGKIIHEIRRGEWSIFEHVPHSRYYGSIDSTPLFLLLMWETYRWTGDKELIKQLLPHAEAALQWIHHYGDLDGDGFVEYKRRTRRGLRNQGWKDSGDSISFADGALATGAIALVEVQAYVYAAKRSMAGIYRMLGDPRAYSLEQEAVALKDRFNQAFWMPDKGYYAVALDGDKRQVDSITSNPGHCLWCGIVDEDKAARVAERLMAPDMFAGWGIRTLSSNMPRYDPLSYHNGSIWPHDNSIAAAGLMRYGFAEEANRVAMALIEAASVFPDNRLPELFAGYPRREYSFPVPYPAANAPQAWASGALIYMLETVLGVRPDAERLLVSSRSKAAAPFCLSGVPYRGQKLDLP